MPRAKRPVNKKTGNIFLHEVARISGDNFRNKVVKVPGNKSPQIKAIKYDPDICDANKDGKIDKKYRDMESFNRDLLCPTTKNKRMRI